MEDAAHQPAAREGPDGPFRALLARDGKAVLAAAAATLLVEAAVFVLARAGHVPVREASLGALMASCVWVALAAPVLAAAPDGALSSLLRGGIVADASAVTLIVLWLAGPTVTLLSAAKVYCTFAAMALLAIGVVRCGRTARTRFALAVIVSVVLMAACATPLWIGGLLASAGAQRSGRILAAGLNANPVYSIASATAAEARFVWHQTAVMYRLTWVTDYAPPPVAWYACPAVYLPAAAAFGVLAWLRRRARPETDAPGASA